MNTLNIIRKQIEKACCSNTTLRSTSPSIVVTTLKFTKLVKPVHGTFVYRGRTYTK